MAIQDHPRYVQINNYIQANLPTIRDSQASYFVANGNYFQGLRIPSSDVDGITAIVADVDSHPADQLTSWFLFNGTLYPKNVRIEVNVQIHAYQSPAGYGWILIIEILWNGERWRWMHHEGPENWPIPFDTWILVA